MAHPYQSCRQHKSEKDRVSKIAHRASGGRVQHDDEAEDKALIRRTVKKAALKADGAKSKHRADRAPRARGGRTEAPNDVKATLKKEAAVSAPTKEINRKRGGRVKGKTIVNVNVAPQAGVAGPAPMPMPVPPALAPAGAPPAPIGAPNALAAKPPMMGAGAPPVAPGPLPMRKRGGRVKSGPAWEEGRKNGTQVSHDPGKNDLSPENLDCGRPVTFRAGGKVVSFRASGGKVEAPKGVAAATKLPGGVASGEGRVAQAKRVHRRGSK